MRQVGANVKCLSAPLKVIGIKQRCLIGCSEWGACLIFPPIKSQLYDYKLIGYFSLVDLKFFFKISIFKNKLKFCSYFQVK